MPPVVRSPLRAQDGDNTMSSTHTEYLDVTVNEDESRAAAEKAASERAALEGYLTLGTSLLDPKRCLQDEMAVVNARMMKLDETLVNKNIGKALSYQMRLVCMHAMAVAEHAIEAYKTCKKEMRRRECDLPMIRLVEDRVRAQGEALDKIDESLKRIVHVQTEIHGAASEAKDIVHELKGMSEGQASGSLGRNSAIRGDRLYSEVARSNGRKRDRPLEPKYPIIIDPKVHKDSKKTKEAWENLINPVTLGLGVRNINEGKDGRLYVDLSSKEQVERVKADLATKDAFDLEYKLTVSERRRPCVRIFGVPEGISDDDLLSTMYTQNEEISDKIAWDEFLAMTRLKYVSKPFKGIRRVVLEAEARLWKIMVEMTKVKVKWSLCRLENYVSLPQCFVCCGFGHLSVQKQRGSLPERTCTKQQVCDFCTGNHKFKDCLVKKTEGAKPKCVNCAAESVRTGNASIRTDHRASSDVCPVFRRRRDQELQKTEYGF